jgi:hypothetical protein
MIEVLELIVSESGPTLPLVGQVTLLGILMTGQTITLEELSLDDCPVKCLPQGHLAY